MSDSLAAADYEPTPDEIREWVSSWEEMGPGHGNAQMIPAFADRCWLVRGVWWSNRTTRDDGWVDIDWLIPRSLH